jgi:hypothetical protein
MAQNLLDQFLDVVSGGQTYNSESFGHRLHDGQGLASDGSGRSENGNLLQLKVLHFLAGSPSEF